MSIDDTRAIILPLFGVLSLVAAGWVANDAARRRRSWFGWAFLVANTSILGLILWSIVRKNSPAPDVRLGPLKSGLLWLAAVPVVLLNYLIATFIIVFLFQVARIEGHAMEPLLNDQDRVIVNKLVYRMRAPQPGDIVMHRYPLSPERSFVKRVIAKDGDTVRIVDGRVYVNDVALNDDAYVTSAFRSHDTWGPQVIRQGYFVLGDHRNNSSDSRHWGVVPTDYILGKVTVRWWPIRDAAIF
jgi:signal peptidase I